MNISEETLISWSQGPGKSEEDKCENAEKAVRKAITADSKLSKMDVSVFAQGSYKARTNIRQDSDVDICVLYNSSYFPEYQNGLTKELLGHSDGTLAYADFKNLVELALKNYFGEAVVKRGKKAFDIHANTYRIDADVVPTFQYRCYTGQRNSDGTFFCYKGVAFEPDNGKLIVNWPEQAYSNGVQRNDETGRSYKRVIRILKRLRNKMQEDKVAEASDIASFLIECLVWNVSLEAFKKDTFTATLRHVIADAWNRSRKDEDCLEWREVSQLKYLFRSSQPWTRQQANQFLDAAWNYMGYS